jgi:hypothetical protein
MFDIHSKNVLACQGNINHIYVSTDYQDILAKYGAICCDKISLGS